jgi:hypothetical protein
VRPEGQPDSGNLTVPPVNLIGTPEEVRTDSDDNAPSELGLALTQISAGRRGLSSDKAGQRGVSFDNPQHVVGSTPSASWTRMADGASKSGGAALVPMVQSTDFRERDYTPLVATLNRPRVPSVFSERKMRPGSMVMFDEHAEPAAQVPLAKHGYVIEAFTPNGPDHPLGVCPQPWGAQSR